MYKSNAAISSSEPRTFLSIKSNLISLTFISKNKREDSNMHIFYNYE